MHHDQMTDRDISSPDRQENNNNDNKTLYGYSNLPLYIIDFP